MSCLKRFGLAASLCLALGMTEHASAEGVPLTVIGPHEFELPVGYEPFNGFAQYFSANSTAQYFDNDGRLTHGTQHEVAAGLTKFVHFTSIDALPGVGIALQAIIPEVHLGTQGGQSIDGFGDPVAGFATWIKPSPSSTLGVQSVVSAPIGSRLTSSYYWSNITTLFFDFQSESFSHTGELGGIFRTRQNYPGAEKILPGDTMFVNYRLGYKLAGLPFPVEPYLAVDYQISDQSRLYATRDRLRNSNSEEVALGGGIAMFFTPKMSLSIHYSRGVSAINTAPTNGAFMRFVYIP